MVGESRWIRGATDQIRPSASITATEVQQTDGWNRRLLLRRQWQIDGDLGLSANIEGQTVNVVLVALWKAKFGGRMVSEIQRLKALSSEKDKLKCLLAVSMLDNLVLKGISFPGECFPGLQV